MSAPEILDAAGAAALVDVEQGLASRRLFVDETLFELEMERIFTRAWVFVGLESEIPNAGDYVTRSLGLDPVILVRDQHGRVQVFHNSCPHRGAMICQADSGHVKGFVCAYHGWAFGLDGRFHSAFHPKEFYRGAVPFDQLGLHRAAQVDTYGGMVFATWDATAPPLSDTLDDTVRWYFDMFFARTPQGLEVLGPPHRWVFEHNWKVGPINFCGDGPHAPLLHNPVSQMAVGESAEQFMNAIMGESPDVMLGHGSAMLLNLTPGERLDFVGYHPELVKLHRQMLDDTRFGFLGRMMTSVATLFPNLSLMQLPVRFDAGEPSINFFALRLWQPISATRTEAWHWFLADRELPDDWKARTLKAGLRSFSAAGTFDQDDSEAWSAMTRGIRGPVGRRLDLNFQAMRGWRDDFWADFPGPGKTCRNMFTEATEFEYLVEWRRWMAGEK
jgi:nitrite reductase/ring-hydroxylating ferredoxin subunit